MDGARYLQHSDGTWEVVGADGWPIPMNEYLELHADVTAALAAVDETPVDERLLIAVRHGLLCLRGPRRATR